MVPTWSTQIHVAGADTKEESEEADSAESYEKTTQENKVATMTKSQDAKYKTKEAAGLDKTIAELSSDRDTSNSELSAVVTLVADGQKHQIFAKYLPKKSCVLTTLLFEKLHTRTKI